MKFYYTLPKIGKGVITHKDIEDRGLSFNVTGNNIEVSGLTANVTAWANRVRATKITADVYNKNVTTLQKAGVEKDIIRLNSELKQKQTELSEKTIRLNSFIKLK